MDDIKNLLADDDQWLSNYDEGRKAYNQAFADMAERFSIDSRPLLSGVAWVYLRETALLPPNKAYKKGAKQAYRRMRRRLKARMRVARNKTV
jgi:hypothetical protein